MLGLRGCRLGITMPEITRMQVKAIFQAACEVAREGKKIVPEIMIPLVGMASEMKAQKELIRDVAQQTMAQYGMKLNYLVGTMIELPRAAVTAGSIAQDAEFFSFGTNDLTQTTFGFSRDDAGPILDFILIDRIDALFVSGAMWIGKKWSVVCVRRPSTKKPKILCMLIPLRCWIKKGWAH